MFMVLLILELRKIKREMAVQRNKTESNGETTCDETEKSEGMSEIENHCNGHFQTNAGSMESEERL
jgi:hypothetical protein